MEQALQDMHRNGGTRNWTFRRGLELTAVQTAAQGHAAEAWLQLEKAQREADLATIRAPSRIEHAESLLRRATVLTAAGRMADAAALQAPLREALQGQHPNSPRRVWSTVTP